MEHFGTAGKGMAGLRGYPAIPNNPSNIRTQLGLPLKWCSHTYTHTHSLTDTSTHTDADTHTHTHKQTQTQTHTHIYTHMHTHTYTNIHTHAHTQRYTHTYTDSYHLIILALPCSFKECLDSYTLTSIYTCKFILRFCSRLAHS